MNRDSIISKTNDIININSNRIAKKNFDEECKNDYNMCNEHNKLIDSKEFFFNYRSDENFNRMNKLETKPVNKNYNYENNISFNHNTNIDSLENIIKKTYIKNEYYYKNNINEENINKIKDIQKYDLKNSINSIDSMKMKELSEEENEIQKEIKYEEKMLNELKEEKKKLIEEEKKRREILLKEINNNKNEIKEKKEEIKEIIYECQKEKNELKKNKEKMEIYLNSNYNNDNYITDSESNYYKEYLQQIRERNQLINKKSSEIIRKKILNNNLEDIKIYYEKNISDIEDKNEEQKENNITYKKLTNNNIYNNLYSSYNKNKRMKRNDNSYNKKIPSKTNLSNNSVNNSIQRKKERKVILNSINLKSYFKLNEKERNLNYTSEEKKSNEKDKTYEKKNYIYSTPDGLYRNNNTDNSKFKIYKSLSPNNNNYYMTQTRFYRSSSLINPDELSSRYAKEKVSAVNSFRNKSCNKNKNIYSFAEINLDNYKTNQSTNNLRLNEENKETNNEDDIYLNYSNNLFKQKNDIKRLNAYKTNCFLEKGKSYYNMQKNKERNCSNKMFNIKSNDNSKNYLCANCLRNKILLNDN